MEQARHAKAPARSLWNHETNRELFDKEYCTRPSHYFTVHFLGRPLSLFACKEGNNAAKHPTVRNFLSL